MRRLLFILMCLLTGCSDEQHSILQSDAISEAMDSAQSKFAQRERNRADLILARQITTQALETAPKPLQSEALPLADILFRTYDYEASHYLKGQDQKEERKRLYQEGIAAVDRYISPDALKFDYAPYFYFKALFLIKLSDDSTFMEQLQAMKVLLPLLDKAYYDPVPGADIYEGGGVYRLKAMVKSREYYKGVPGGTYNPAEALILINRALKSEAYPGSYPGDLFCENFRLKAEIERLNTRNHKRASLFHAQTAFVFDSYLKDDLVPDIIQAETKDCIESSRLVVSQDGYIIRNAVEGDDDHEFEYEVGVTFVSDDARSSTLALEAYCVTDDYVSGPNGIIAQKTFPYNGSSQRNRPQTFSLSVSGDSISCSKFLVLFDNARTALPYVDVSQAVLKNYRLTNEAYLAQTNPELDRKAIQLLNFSTSMAGQVGAKQNAYCLIKKAVLKKIDDGVLREMKNNYFNVFGTRFDTDKFTCPPDKTLADEISVCKSNPALSTPFCNSYRLYLVPLGWVFKSLAETKERLARLEGITSQVTADLGLLRDRLQLEADQSKDVLGETDD